MILACDVPSESALDPEIVANAWFRDAYRAPLRRTELAMPALFFAIFGHHPAWMKLLLIARNRVAGAAGLAVPAAGAILNPQIRAGYAVGDCIGTWPIFAISENEIIAGRDNGHLDFRLSILRAADHGAFTVSTICKVHHFGGKLYLLLIIPFHKYGLRRLLATALAANRL